VRQGFASVVDGMEHGATLWCVAHLPQNRDVWALTAGDGTVGLYRYRYPDKRCAAPRPRSRPGCACLPSARQAAP